MSKRLTRQQVEAKLREQLGAQGGGSAQGGATQNGGAAQGGGATQGGGAAQQQQQQQGRAGGFPFYLSIPAAILAPLAIPLILGFSLGVFGWILGLIVLVTLPIGGAIAMFFIARSWALRILLALFVLGFWGYQYVGVLRLGPSAAWTQTRTFWSKPLAHAGEIWPGLKASGSFLGEIKSKGVSAFSSGKPAASDELLTAEEATPAPEATAEGISAVAEAPTEASVEQPTPAADNSGGIQEDTSAVAEVTEEPATAISEPATPEPTLAAIAQEDSPSATADAQPKESNSSMGIWVLRLLLIVLGLGGAAWLIIWSPWGLNNIGPKPGVRSVPMNNDSRKRRK